jgi:hypothetical protein
LWGAIINDREGRTLIITTENISGVKEVHNHQVWIEPMSAMDFLPPEDKARERAETYGPARST